MTEKIEAQILEIIRNNANLENSSAEMSPDDQILSLGITSRSFLEIVVALECEFNFEFADEYLDVRQFNTFNDLIDYVKEHMDQN